MSGDTTLVNGYLRMLGADEVAHIHGEWAGLTELLRLWDFRCGWLERNPLDPEYAVREAATLELAREIGRRGDAFAEWLNSEPYGLSVYAQSQSLPHVRLEAVA